MEERELAPKPLPDVPSAPLGDAAVISADVPARRARRTVPRRPQSVARPAGAPHFCVAGPAVDRLLRQTVPIADKEPCRYAFDGILTIVGRPGLTFVATNGRQLVVANAPLVAVQIGCPTPVEMILPARLLRAAVDPRCPPQIVRFWLRADEVFVGAEDQVFRLERIQRRFPPYQDVIPTRSDKVLHVQTADLSKAIRDIAPPRNDPARAVVFALGRHGLTVSRPDGTAAGIRVDGRYDGDDLVIGFNPSFLTDVLRLVEGTDVELEFTSPQRPMVLKAGPDFLYVLMPVLLNGGLGGQALASVEAKPHPDYGV